MGSKFDAKVKTLKNHGRRKQAASTIAERMREIENIIIFNTYKYGGIKHNQLASLAGLDRRSLEPYLKKLLSLEKIRRNGKKGKYSSSAIDPSQFDSSSLALAIMFKKLFKLKIGTVKDNNYYHLSFSDNTIQKWLFELSNKLGAYIIFLFIESMNPGNDYTTGGKYDDLLSGESLSIEWATNSFTPILGELLRQFRDGYLNFLLSDPNRRNDIIELGLYALNCSDCDTYAEGYNKSELWSNFLGHKAGHRLNWYKVESSKLKRPIDEPTTLELYQANNLTLSKKLTNQLKHRFKLLYPILYELFEKFMRDIPTQIDYNKRQWEDHVAYDTPDEMRLRCKHHYSKTLTVDKYKYKECSKCHDIIPKNFKIGDIL